MEPVLSGFLEEEGERGGDWKRCGKGHVQNSLISHYVRIAISPQIAVNIGGGGERTRGKQPPPPSFMQAPASSPRLFCTKGVVVLDL